MLEILLKIIGAIAALFLPIILAYLNNKLAHLKNGRESRAELLKLAEDLDFDSKDLNKKTILYKDRLAKSLFNNDYLTYEEARFFSQYENADFWVKEYAEIRGLLKRERDTLGAITEITPKYTKKRVWLCIVGYFIFAFIGIIPFVMMNKYISWIVSYYERGMLVSIFLLVMWPIIFLSIGYLFLRYSERCATCRIFLHDFKKDAFKSPILIEPPENPQVTE
ncbi:hypothetical protein P255_01009 [Acinetobacter brisouii CIP 110357]|uniref:Uncharacterized protein n=1 Tax=Acinetobacter brisouii CIP 110357 TaxID=1341683 RepID=V2VVZ6_9GAMM|nr:hypothetical protein [Acinetobacter brisouii]ENV48130.1 hypothetical protein F954_01197 [Acinetobacter brisouii ANC 4119]ESK51914.1 hypothetical protein P255_01009 [Acinetobacter brisouii CIP 110357]